MTLIIPYECMGCFGAMLSYDYERSFAILAINYLPDELNSLIINGHND